MKLRKAILIPALAALLAVILAMPVFAAERALDLTNYATRVEGAQAYFESEGVNDAVTVLTEDIFSKATRLVVEAETFADGEGLQITLCAAGNDWAWNELGDMPYADGRYAWNLRPYQDWLEGGGMFVLNGSWWSPWGDYEIQKIILYYEDGNGGDGPKTGDNFPIMLLTGLLVLSAAGSAVIVRKMKKA